MRWTVRNIDEDVVDIIREVAEQNGMLAGDCVNDAVRFWYEALPDADEIADQHQD